MIEIARMILIRLNLITAFMLIIGLFLSPALAQDTNPLYYLGVYGSYNYNIHSSDFDHLKDIKSCCPRFTSGTGSGFAVGGLFEIELKQSLNFGLRFGYSSIGAQLKENEFIGYQQVLDVTPPNNASVKPVYTDHYIKSSLHTVGLEPYISFNFIEHLNMYAGFRAAYLFSGKIDSYEQITTPENVTFLDGRIVQNDVYVVDLPDRQSLQFFGILGIGYELPLSRSTTIMPEMRYNIPFTDLSSVTWKAGSFQVGVALKVPVMPPKKLPVIRDTTIKRDTTIIAILGQKTEQTKLFNSSSEEFYDETSEMKHYSTIITEHYEKTIPKVAKLSTSISAVGISKDGSRSDNPTIIIEENETEEGFPLLPYVYFPEGRSDLNNLGLNLLPKDAAERFDESRLPWNTMKIYADMLNIIGSRLRQNPNSDITVTGCNVNMGVEKNNIELSASRAESVKSYFVDVWGIDPKRIRIRKQNLPDNPGNIMYRDGQVENQRAEISSPDINILRPVSLKEIVRSSNPPIVEINPKAIADAGIKSWEALIVQEGKVLRKFKGTDTSSLVVWNVEEEPLPTMEAPVGIYLTATDNINQNSSAEKMLTLKQLTIKKKRYELKDDKRIERFSLILFDFDKAEITPRQRTVLEEIKPRIKPNSHVSIEGYADRTGEADYNRLLTHRRTLEVQKVLQVPEPNLTLKPVGNDVLLYDNDTAEGRSYCRTVKIIIETPVK